jgi:hypothetical protein
MDHDDLPNEAETCRKRKDAGRESASEREEDSSASKKPRVVWSAEMHLQFVHAVNQLGIDSEWRKAGRGRAGGGGGACFFFFHHQSEKCGERPSIHMATTAAGWYGPCLGCISACC